MAKYVIFLDIDGVFTSSRAHCFQEHTSLIWTKFDPIAIEFMNYIHDHYDADFVLMTSWKDGVPDTSKPVHWIFSCFVNAGFRGNFPEYWRTNPQEDPQLENSDRAYQVKDYLNKFDYDDFMLFDDTSYRFNEVLGVKRHIRTSSHDGLLYKHMLNAKSIMGGWKKK